MTEAGLAKLHKQVMVAMTAHFRTEAQWQHMVDTVLWLEDNHKNSSSSEKIFRRQSSTEPGPGLYLSPHIEWQAVLSRIVNSTKYRIYSGFENVSNTEYIWL